MMNNMKRKPLRTLINSFLSGAILWLVAIGIIIAILLIDLFMVLYVFA